MSSMRNAVQRRNHRERAQPLERQKWGLLEKHKDYSLRAKDHNTKKRKIKQLTDKARERNEDEFYFAMVNSSSEGGRKRARRDEGNGGAVGLTDDVVRLMKTQDAGYLRTMLQHARAESKALEEDVTTQREIRRGHKVNKRIVFDEDTGVATLPGSVRHEDKMGELDDDMFEDVESDDVDTDSDNESKDETEDDEKRKHKLEVDTRKLRALQDRETQLAVALRSLEDQRARMSGTVGGVNKHGTKFKVRARKR